MEPYHVAQITQAQRLLANHAPQTSLSVAGDVLADLTGHERDRAILTYADAIDELVPRAILTGAVADARGYLETGLAVAIPSDPDARDYHTRAILEHGARYQGLLGLTQIPRFERSATQAEIRALEKQLISLAFSIRDWGAAQQAAAFHEASSRYLEVAKRGSARDPLVHTFTALARRYEGLERRVPKAA